MPTPPILCSRWLPAVCVLIALLGCASRSAPPRTPRTSAASLAAPEGARAHVTHALDGDPPLPGESVEAWPGLQPKANAPDPHAHHHRPSQGSAP